MFRSCPLVCFETFMSTVPAPPSPGERVRLRILYHLRRRFISRTFVSCRVNRPHDELPKHCTSRWSARITDMGMFAFAEPLLSMLTMGRTCCARPRPKDTGWLGHFGHNKASGFGRKCALRMSLGVLDWIL